MQVFLCSGSGRHLSVSFPRARRQNLCGRTSRHGAVVELRGHLRAAARAVELQRSHGHEHDIKFTY